MSLEFELQKLSKVRKNRRMEDWLNLINAETEEQLMAVDKPTQIPEVRKTIVKLREMKADEKVRQEAFIREKSLLDWVSAIKGAEARGEVRGELKTLGGLVRDGLLPKDVAAARAGMTVPEFERQAGLGT